MPTAPSDRNNNSSTGQVFTYFSSLTLLYYLAVPTGYLVDIVTAYMLKNQLHASATEVSLFRLLTAIPVYFSFVFGMTRDLWNPFRLRDRGYFLLFGIASAVVFVWLAFSDLTYARLFTGLLVLMTTFRFVGAAYQGLMALVGQEKLMSGRLSALWQIILSVPYVLGGFAAGYITEHVPYRYTFTLLAVMSLLIAAFVYWKPRGVFGDAYEKPLAKGTNLRGDIKRLLKHRAIYPAVIIMFMFQFAPGSNTPLQFYLTDHLHASDAIYGDFNAIFAASFIPAFFFYGWLCKRVSLKKLLWWGTVITIPQMMPLAFIHSAQAALWLATPMGLMGGIAAVAYYDLAMRSCPPGLQGTLMMMVDGVFYLSYRGGDFLGVQIYNSSPEHGFLYCVLSIAAVYALILPMLLLIPKDVIATADGEANPALERATLTEITEPKPMGG